MKSSNVLAWGIACGLGVGACGRQTLDEAPVADAGPPEVARAAVTAVVAAAHPPVGTLGRDCRDSSDCSGWQDPDPGLVCCGGTCMNTHADVFNCGGCARACAAGEICVDGSCRAPAIPALGDPPSTAQWGASCATTRCAAGEICCGGKCDKPDRDAYNCGACGVACRATGADCYSGACCPAIMPTAACRPSMCPEDRVFCAGACKDLGDDAANCGACGAVCPPSAPTCVSGLCVALSR